VLDHKIGQLALVARAVPSVLPKWPAKDTSTMVTMHGFFDLKDETSEPGFHRAMDDIVGRLKECELISSHKVLRRSPKENYDSNPPSTRYHTSMDFENFGKCVRMLA
jgi:hypothetical protein